jgi:hypothetical protein
VVGCAAWWLLDRSGSALGQSMPSWGLASWASQSLLHGVTSKTTGRSKLLAMAAGSDENGHSDTTPALRRRGKQGGGRKRCRAAHRGGAEGRRGRAHRRRGGVALGTDGRVLGATARIRRLPVAGVGEARLGTSGSRRRRGGHGDAGGGGSSVGTGLWQPGGFGAQPCAARRASDGGVDQLGAASSFDWAMGRSARRRHRQGNFLVLYRTCRNSGRSFRQVLLLIF